MKDEKQNMQEPTGKGAGGGMRDWFAMSMTEIREMITMSRTKEGRALLVSRSKGAATLAKDKIIVVWQSGIKGKIVLCVFTLLVLWLFVPSCRREADSGKTVVEKEVSGRQPQAISVGFTKLRDTDDLWFEGSLPEGLKWQTDLYGGKWLDEEDADYDKFETVSPNLIVFPKDISLLCMLYGFNPQMDSAIYRQKGVSYLDRSSFSHAVVTHVGKGFVVTRAADAKNYGNSCGYIVTDDEYVEGDDLKNGFYTYIGTKTVPLANGSSHTMHAFAKVDEAMNNRALAALKYNEEAVAAAKKEIERRSRTAQRTFDANPKAVMDDMFRKALAGYDHAREGEKIRSRIHVSGALKGKVEIVDMSKWEWYTENGREELDFDEFKRRLETIGGAKYVELWGKQTMYGQSLSDVETCLGNLFKRNFYHLSVKHVDGHPKLKCYSVTDQLSWQGDGTDITGIHPKCKEHIYIVDTEKDDDIIGEVETSSDWGQGAAALVKAFEKKYGGR